MTDKEALEMVERFSVSWYVDVDRIDPTKVYRGDTPKAPEGEAQAAAMQANVDEALRNSDGIRERYRRAEAEGLFDVDALKTASKPVREKWLAVIEVQRGDWQRCVAELNHWRGYHGWALAQARGAAAPAPAAGVADRRLPPEREPGGDDEEPAAYAGASRW